MNVRANLKSCLVMAMFLIAMACPAAVGQIIYVDADANGVNDGSSWMDSYNYLQDALADANSGDEIRVAEGIYTPDSNSADPNGSGDRTATFQLQNGVAIKGGYAGFGEPDANERDIDAYETILSGDLDGNDRWDLWDEPSRVENSYHVVTGSDVNETAVLDGFTIAGGNANGRYNIHENLGGGMYTDSGGVTVMNCTFNGNSARYSGGGMYNSSSVLILVNCTFEENRAKEGGGMESRTSVLTLINCTFSVNIAMSSVGGMKIRDSNATLADCTFSGNIGVSSVGGLGIGDSNVTLTNCTFTGNWTPWPSPLIMGGGGAGGLAIWGGKAIVTDCIFRGNSATGGGGMTSSNADLTLTNCIFSGNSAMYPGGGMINTSRTVPAKITNCLFSGNSAGEGGGIHNSEYGSSAILTNCTFSGNSARAGGAISNTYASNATLTNCILWGNSADRGPQASLRTQSSMETNYCCIEDGQTGIYDPYDGLIWGASNIDLDPCFADPGYWDPNGTPEDANDDFWVDGDYHLKSQAGRWEPSSASWVQDAVTSPCIDAGDMASPIGYEPFPNGGRVNMGAYGGTIEASKSYFGEPVCETIVAGDINGDCIVNFVDFAVLAFHWLEDNRLPSQASNPSPRNYATGVSITYTILSWTPGYGAVSHDVYFGTTSPGSFCGNQTGTTFNPGPMQSRTTYYWRIDEVNPFGTTTGEVWHFTTTTDGGEPP